MKVDDDYVFSEEGVYRVRAVYRPIEPPVVVGSGAGSRPPPAPSLRSASLDIEVGPRGSGRSEYVESHPWENVYGAFRLNGSLEDIRGHLGRYGDYRHEQEKLLVYQDAGGAVIRCLLIDQVHNQPLIDQARSSLEFAERVGVGLEMWRWIVGKLTGFPAVAPKAGWVDASGGYYF